MKEYRAAKSNVIFGYIFAPLIIALFCWLLIMPFVSDNTAIELAYFFVPTSLCMIGFMVIALIDISKGKVIISHNTISTRSSFINRDLKFNEIKGFIIEQGFIFIIPNTNLKKQIKISIYIGKVNELIMWLSSNFPDLNTIEEKEKTEILENFEFGLSKKEREIKLNQAKKVAKALDWIGGLIFAWTFIKPQPYEFAILASISFPIIAILVVIYYKGLIRVYEHKGENAYPTVFFSISMTTFGLLLRAITDYNIYDYNNIWTLSFVIGIVMLAIVFIGIKKFEYKGSKNYILVIFLALLFWGFGYGAVVTLNCIYDESTPNEFKSKVIDKQIISDKSTTYKIELKAWNTQTENDYTSVSKTLYKSLEIGDNVNIHLKKGCMGIPWFNVTK